MPDLQELNSRHKRSSLAPTPTLLRGGDTEAPWRVSFEVESDGQVQRFQVEVEAGDEDEAGDLALELIEKARVIRVCRARR